MSRCGNDIAVTIESARYEGENVIRKIPEDVQAAIDAKVASGLYSDEVSVLREALTSLDEFDEDVAKLKTAIDDWQSGDVGMPIDQAVDLVRGNVEGSSE